MKNSNSKCWSLIVLQNLFLSTTLYKVGSTKVPEKYSEEEKRKLRDKTPGFSTSRMFNVGKKLKSEEYKN